MNYSHMFRDILEVVTKEDLIEANGDPTNITTSAATTPPPSSDPAKAVGVAPEVPPKPKPEPAKKVTDVNYNVSGGYPAAEFAPIEEPLDPEMIGKIYIMKKIYVRLISVDRILQNFVDPKYDSMRDDVSEAIEMFNTIALNFDAFQDKIDELIIMYQQLVIRVLDELKNVKAP